MLRPVVVFFLAALGLTAADAQAQIYPPAPIPPEPIGSHAGRPGESAGGLYRDEENLPAGGARLTRESRPAPFHAQPAAVEDWAQDRAASRAPRPSAAVGAADEDITGAVQSRTQDGPRVGPAPRFRRQLVSYPTREPAGTLVVDTANTFLYYVLGNGQAVRYGIGVGRDGFTWSGRERISRMAEWPDWHPPTEMIGRQPYLPRFMAGGPGNPLGARALYLGSTIYRIHGTNEPNTIGKTVSSGCIRLLNEDVEDLYRRVSVGTRVLVLPGRTGVTASAR